MEPAPAGDVASMVAQGSWPHGCESMAAAGRARPRSGHRSSQAKAGGVKNLRHREEGYTGRNLRHAAAMVLRASDEPRRAAEVAPCNDHGGGRWLEQHPPGRCSNHCPPPSLFLAVGWSLGFP